MVMEQYITIPNAIALFFLIGMAFAAMKNNAFTHALGAFDNKDEGYSARKLTAFGFAILILYTLDQGFKRNIIDKTNILEVIGELCFVLLMALALVKIDDLPKILRAWKGNPEPPNG